MKIKINESNRAAITAALVAANGRATAHTFIGATPILEAAVAAESKLKRLGLNNAQKVGAIAKAYSGSALPRAYKYQRTTSVVVLMRGGAGWYITDVMTRESWDYSAGCTLVNLTAAQDAIAVGIFRSSYGKQPIVAEVAKEVA